MNVENDMTSHPLYAIVCYSQFINKKQAVQTFHAQYFIFIKVLQTFFCGLLQKKKSFSFRFPPGGAMHLDSKHPSSPLGGG